MTPGKLAVAGDDRTLTLPVPKRQALRALGDAVTAQANAHRCLNDGDPLAAARHFKAIALRAALSRALTPRSD